MFFSTLNVALERRGVMKAEFRATNPNQLNNRPNGSRGDGETVSYVPRFTGLTPRNCMEVSTLKSTVDTFGSSEES